MNNKEIAYGQLCTGYPKILYPSPGIGLADLEMVTIEWEAVLKCVVGLKQAIAMSYCLGHAGGGNGRQERGRWLAHR